MHEKLMRAFQKINFPKKVLPHQNHAPGHHGNVKSVRKLSLDPQTDILVMARWSSGVTWKFGGTNGCNGDSNLHQLSLVLMSAHKSPLAMSWGPPWNMGEEELRTGGLPGSLQEQQEGHGP